MGLVAIKPNFAAWQIFAILKSKPACKLINRIQGWCLLMSSTPCSSSRTHVESFGKPRDSTIFLQALPGKLDTKRHSPSIFYIQYNCSIPMGLRRKT